MNSLEDFLNSVVANLSQYFAERVGICAVHPGLLDAMEQDQIKTLSPAIYTTVLDIIDTQSVPTQQQDVKVKVVSFILVYNLAAQQRDRLCRSLANDLVLFISQQRWGLNYAFPTEKQAATDLYGLLRSPNQMVGDQGWSPTLQARAMDLYGDIVSNTEPQFSIWSVTWEQTLRLGDNVFSDQVL